MGAAGGDVRPALSEMSHSGVAAGGGTGTAGTGPALLRAARVGRCLRAARAGVRREMGAAVRTGNTLRPGAALGRLRELAVRGEARSGLRRLRAGVPGVRRELRTRGARVRRELRPGCGMLALRLGGRTEQVPTVACLRLERSSVWAVLRRVRMGTDGSLRRL